MMKASSDGVRFIAANARWAFVFIALLCIAAVAAALVSQHFFDMQPCPWCVLQRVLFLMVALVCGLAALGRGRVLRLGFSAVALLFSVSGAAAALWQHFGAGDSNSCSVSLAEKLISGLGVDRLFPDVMAPRASCADAAIRLFGVPYEFWSLALFIVVAVAQILLMATLSKPITHRDDGPASSSAGTGLAHGADAR